MWAQQANAAHKASEQPVSLPTTQTTFPTAQTDPAETARVAPRTAANTLTATRGISKAEQNRI